MSSDPRRHLELTSFDFLNGGGEMGSRMRALDWAETPFGPPEEWPQILRSALSLCLASNFQIAIYWGPELALLYNDEWSHIPGDKHPWALGRPAREVWPEIWDTIGPMFQRVLAEGEATRSRDELLAMHRHGFTEECYFDYTLSPIRDEAGRVGGAFNIAVETTFRVIAERRTRLLKDLGEATNQARTVEEACAFAIRALSSDPADLPFALVYVTDPKQPGAMDLAGSTGFSTNGNRASVCLRVTAECAKWPFAEAVGTRSAVLVEGLSRTFGVEFPGGPWPEACERAVVVPLPQLGASEPSGVLVAGLSPRLLFDPEYRAFVDRVAAITATAITNARAYEHERRRAETLTELDRAKTAFFSNVSHEFRTPLTLMLGPIEDILAKPEGRVAPDNRELLAVVHRSGLRLQRLVNTLLDFSRIEAGRAQASFEPTDLCAFTAELASSFRSAMDRAGLEFTVDCEQTSGPVYVDREMWEKIVLNLLSNAFKYTLEGSVALRLSERDHSVELVVEDTGLGIPEEELPRIFDRFHRIESTRGRTHEGTGIGLALVQELVKLHGGSVSASSVVGRGSIFTVRLPLGSAHLPAERIGAGRTARSTALHADAYVEEALRWLPQVEGAEEQFESRQLLLPGVRSRVLLADDNADMRDYVKRLLGARYDVTAVSNGQEALTIALENPPDLVLTDVMMPVLDGFGLLASLRSDERTKTLPVLMLSARAGEESRVEGLGAGADDYLVKPFTARELLARVEAHLSLARIRRAADEARRLSDVRLRLALDATGIVAWQWDPATDEVTTIGDLSCIFGKNIRSTAEGLARVHPDDVGDHRAKLQRVAREGGSYSSELRVQRIDTNATTWLEERGTAILGDDGRVLMVVGVTADVTQRKLAQDEMRRKNEELTKLNRELEEFAYVSSHDLQEPLRMVNIYSQLLVKQFGAGSLQAGEYARFINQGVSRMEMLIRDLLTYSRTIQHEESLLAQVDLSAALTDALSILQTRIEESGAMVTSERLPVARGETKQLSHVFQNLLSNALKYRKEDVALKIEIGMKREGSEWIISVRDNGIGFEQQYASRIFGLFKRLHSDTYPGTGLGLAICQRIVERYGGRIWAEGRPAIGATFYFTLPVAEEQ